MKKIITIIMVLCLMIGTFTVSTFAASSSGTKYIKVKASTYTKYKKAYNNQKKLTEKIQKKDAQIKKLKENLESEKSKNNWVWMNIYSLGISYSDKKWSVPRTIPSKFIINGVTYTTQWE